MRTIYVSCDATHRRLVINKLHEHFDTHSSCTHTPVCKIFHIRCRKILLLRGIFYYLSITKYPKRSAVLIAMSNPKFRAERKNGSCESGDYCGNYILPSPPPVWHRSRADICQIFIIINTQRISGECSWNKLYSALYGGYTR